MVIQLDNPSKRKPARILVVEDEKIMAEMLEKVLVDEGYQVFVALDGNTAHEALTDFSPDLALLDLHVPHRNGFELLGEIRKRDQDLGAFVPVIILTGVYTSRNDKVSSLKSGADDFISKPFDLIELLARVHSLLRVQELYKRSQFLATHDPLTRCYNRRYMMDFLGIQYERFKRYKEPISFLMLDLDHFKQINDQMGHEAGDQVLLQVGFLLQDFFRAVDCVARLGGDEFAAVLPGCPSQEASKVADRLLKGLSRAFAEGGPAESLAGKVSFSIGIASLPDHTRDKDELIKLADRALYDAKRAGRNQFKLAA